MKFKTRTEAGQALIPPLDRFKNSQEAVVIGLARGGVIVAFEVAKGLGLPIDILVPRKLGAPGNPELAIGAVADQEVWLNRELISHLSIPSSYIEEEIQHQKTLAKKRLALYKNKSPPLNLKNKTVLIIDDGIATGFTMLASIAALKKKNPAKIIVAIPVGAPDSIENLKQYADQVVCLLTPNEFISVSEFFSEFPEVQDNEVSFILSNSN